MPPKDQFSEVQLLLKGHFALNTLHIAYFFSLGKQSWENIKQTMAKLCKNCK